MELDKESSNLQENVSANVPPPLPARPKQTTSEPPGPYQDESNNSPEGEIDVDDEISQQMTASYSEISFKSGFSPENEAPSSLMMDSITLENHIKQRPVTLSASRNVSTELPLGPLDLEGMVHVEGNMTCFIAEDLEYKIKLSSPVTKKGDTPLLPGGSRSSTPNVLHRQLLTPQLGQLDSGLLNDLESEARRLATSIDNLTENLCGILHSVNSSYISSITADNVDVYKNAVSKMSDAMDGNIKSMYTIMAKVEEVAQAMKSVQAHSTKIREIKRLVDFFESHM